MKNAILFLFFTSLILVSYGQTPCNEPDVPQIGFSDTLICVGESVALTISSGNLNDATRWAWRRDSCDGTVIDTVETIFVNPSQTTTYYVKGEGGCSNQTICAEITIDVNMLPNPTIMGNDTICEDQTAELYFNSESYEFVWFDNSTDSIISLNPTVTTSYFVIVTDTMTDCSNIISFDVFVHTTPSVHIFGESQICSGTPDTLYATGFDTYSWSTGAIDSFIVISPISSEVYLLLATDTNNCSGVETFAVNVLSNPNAEINGDSSLCLGETANLISAASDQYLWSTGDVSQSITVAPTTPTTYSVTITNADGCSDVATINMSILPIPLIEVTSDIQLCGPDSIMLFSAGGDEYLWNTGETTNTIELYSTISAYYSVIITNTTTQCSAYDTVFVDVFSVPSVHIVSDTTIYCNSEEILLVATGANTYQWSTGATNDSIYANPLIDTLFVVMGIDTNLCENTDTLTLEYIVSPVLSLTGDTVICAGDTTTLTVFGADEYVWYNNTSDTFLTVVSDTSVFIYVIGTDLLTGCETHDSVYLYVSHGPNFVFSGDTAICDGQTASISVSGAESVLWWNENTNETITVSPDATTWYVLEGVDSLSCSATDSVLLTVYPTPSPELFLVEDTLCQTDANMGLTGMPGGGYFSGTGVFGAVFLPAVAGPGFHTLFYNLTNSFGCGANDSAVVLVEACVGIEELSENNHFSMYPNPGDGMLNIDLKQTEKAIFTVFNLQGERVSQGTLIAGINTVDLSAFSNGVYTIQVMNKTRVTTERYVLTR